MSFAMYLDVLDAPAEVIRLSIKNEDSLPFHRHIAGKYM